MRTTGVQRSAYEIVNRLLLDASKPHRLFSPKSTTSRMLSLPVEQQGHIRHGHLWEQLELPRIVRRVGRNSVLYSPMSSGPLAVTRQVMTVHDLFTIDHPEWYSKAFSTWYQWLLPRLVRRVAYVLANSNYTQERVLDRFRLPEDKVILCYFAQNEHFTPAPIEAVNLFRDTQALPERYVLFIGSIEPRKNLATLVAAWKRSFSRAQGVKLVIAGGAARRDVFNTAYSGAEALRDPSIHLLGFFSDDHLPLLYQGADAFVLPSLAEGFGLPILEAMACGTPVICSDITAMPEISGGAARLVPAREIEAWTEAIDEIMADPELRQRMSAAGIRRAADFSWSTTASSVRAVLEAV